MSAEYPIWAKEIKNINETAKSGDRRFQFESKVAEICEQIFKIVPHGTDNCFHSFPFREDATFEIHDKIHFVLDNPSMIQVYLPVPSMQGDFGYKYDSWGEKDPKERNYFTIATIEKDNDGNFSKLLAPNGERYGIEALKSLIEDLELAKKKAVEKYGGGYKFYRIPKND